MASSMKKQTILHVIFSLGRGGAETMLVNVLQDLGAYRNIVVTLHPDNEFRDELICDEYVCLQEDRLRSLFLAAFKLKRLIKKYKPVLVHSHLPFSNFAARLATPSHIPLVTTIHTSIAAASEYKKWYIRLIDKATYKFRHSTILAVSKTSQQDYYNVLGLKFEEKNNFLLYTFASEVGINAVGKVHHQNKSIFKMICVGALRPGKNYLYLLNALSIINNAEFQLDIFGEGPQRKVLEAAIEKYHVPVVLKGQVTNINALLPSYDLFVMPSRFEGFSLSVLEAMTARCPMLLSNIPSFREQCLDTALYFDLDDAEKLAAKLLLIKQQQSRRVELAEKAYQRVTTNFTKEHHIKKLKEIYIQVQKNYDIN